MHVYSVKFVIIVTISALHIYIPEYVRIATNCLGVPSDWSCCCKSIIQSTLHNWQNLHVLFPQNEDFGMIFVQVNKSCTTINSIMSNNALSYLILSDPEFLLIRVIHEGYALSLKLWYHRDRVSHVAKCLNAVCKNKEYGRPIFGFPLTTST